MKWWPFRKRLTLESGGILRGMTDSHSHLLPGIDDGVQTLEESLEILRLYEQVGICDVWFTPHIMEEIPNTTVTLQKHFQQFKRVYTGSIRLHLAAEYMLDNLFKERLSQNDLLPLGKSGNHLLVETSYFNPPIDLYDMLRRIQSAGYYPVLAHPERYLYMNETDYQKLQERQVKLQLNLPSLCGVYGPTVQKKAVRLLRAGAYTHVGTDVHTLTSLTHLLQQPLPTELCSKNPV